MAGTPYTPSTNTWRETISLLSGNELPASANFNRVYAELADNIAFAHSFGNAPQNFAGPFDPLNSTGVAIEYAYGPTASKVPTFIAVGGTDKISRSFNGRTGGWTSIVPSGAASMSLSCVATNRNGTWVCAGNGATVVYRSTDNGGTFAATAALPGLAGANGVSSIHWNAGLGLFIASSVNQSSWIATSPDGNTWTQRVSAIAAALTRCASNPAGFTVLLSDSAGTNLCQTSPDGITWTQRSFPASGRWRDVVWSDTHSMFFAVNADAEIVSSPDGITWSLVRNGTGFAEITRIVVLGAYLVILVNGATGVDGQIGYSLDGGVTWYAEPVHSALLEGLCVAKNRVAVSAAGAVYLSGAGAASESAVW